MDRATAVKKLRKLLTLVAAYSETKKQVDKLISVTHCYKFTVGTTSAMFFHVKAQGDSWEEVIEKLGVKS